VLGFQPDEVSSGLRATVDEREDMRRQLRADPDTRRRRRKTLIIAAIQLPIAILLIQLSLNVQWSFGTKAAVVVSEPREAQRATLGNLAMAATGLSLLGVSFLLLARSPFRMPVGERMFRLVWLGPIGRAFVRLSSRGVPHRATGTTAPSVAPVPTRPGDALGPGAAGLQRTEQPAKAVDRVESLEARVAALERWRDGSKP
jgi:hypothetical protein